MPQQVNRLASPNTRMTGNSCAMESIFSVSTLLKNIWCYLIKPVLTINMLSGVVDSVDGLPDGWTYQIVEHGND